ncbi:MAG TPA: carbohydrate kinase family protein [Burkholderiaceae bacterium]
MASLVCGSLAFDTITVFPGRFADQILPEQLHILNVSFLVPTMRREYGGCAGNIAYTLKLLGGEPVVLAALGNDGGVYLERLKSLGISTDAILVTGDNYTAQCFITTDVANNQITAFHPGAMQQAHEAGLPAREDIRLAIIGPDGRDAMLRRARDLAAARIPFVFDPGQGLPMFDGDDLRGFIAQATWVTVNDYEAKMLCDRTGSDLAALSRSHLKGLVVTLGDQGCEVWQQGERTHVPGVAATEVIDPTGCGDAFRGALLYGLERGWPLVDCVALGNRVGALKIAHRGGQNHPIDRAALGL